MNNPGLIVLLLSFAFLISCGGGAGGDTQGILSGQFIDSPVAGLTYKTETRSGVTDAEGRFEYREGETVSFFVDSLLLGDAPGAPTITPLDLIDGSEDETDPAVTNICRFIQTLDDDDLPENGIQLPVALVFDDDASSIDFTLSPEIFEADNTVRLAVSELTSFRKAGQRKLVDAETARRHFRKSLGKDDPTVNEPEPADGDAPENTPSTEDTDAPADEAGQEGTADDADFSDNSVDEPADNEPKDSQNSDEDQANTPSTPSDKATDTEKAADDTDDASEKEADENAEDNTSSENLSENDDSQPSPQNGSAVSGGFNSGQANADISGSDTDAGSPASSAGGSGSTGYEAGNSANPPADSSDTLSENDNEDLIDSSELDDAADQEKGRLKIWTRLASGDEVSGMDEIWLDVASVEACGAGGCEVVGGALRFNLLDADASAVALGDLLLSERKLNQIRLVLGDDNTVVADGETHPLTVPGSSNGELKLLLDKDVKLGKQQALLLDVDPAKNLKFTSGSGYRLVSNIKVTAAVEAPVDADTVVVDPVKGVKLQKAGKFEMTIPASAVGDFSILWCEEFDNGWVSPLFSLGPDGTVFDEPVQVTLYYDTNNIPDDYTEDDLVILHDGEAIPGVVNIVSKTVFGEIVHFSGVELDAVNNSDNSTDTPDSSGSSEDSSDNIDAVGDAQDGPWPILVCYTGDCMIQDVPADVQPGQRVTVIWGLKNDSGIDDSVDLCANFLFFKLNL